MHPHTPLRGGTGIHSFIHVQQVFFCASFLLIAKALAIGRSQLKAREGKVVGLRAQDTQVQAQVLPLTYCETPFWVPAVLKNEGVSLARLGVSFIT